MKGNVFAFVSLLWIKNYQCFSGGIIKFGKKFYNLGKKLHTLGKKFYTLGKPSSHLVKNSNKGVIFGATRDLGRKFVGDCVLIGVIKVDKIDRLNNDRGNFW